MVRMAGIKVLLPYQTLAMHAIMLSRFSVTGKWPGDQKVVRQPESGQAAVSGSSQPPWTRFRDQ